MTEQFSSQAESENSEHFEIPEVQEHFEAISNDLPLYEQYIQELRDMGHNLQVQLNNNTLPEDVLARLARNKEAIDQECEAISMTMHYIQQELSAISEDENRVHDFIHGWRNKIGIKPETQAAETSEEGSSGTSYSDEHGAEGEAAATEETS